MKEKKRKKPRRISKSKFTRPLFFVVLFKVVVVVIGIITISWLWLSDIQAENVLGTELAESNIWKFFALMIVIFTTYFVYKKLDNWHYNLGVNLDYFYPERKWKKKKFGFRPYKPVKKINF